MGKKENQLKTLEIELAQKQKPASERLKKS